MTFPSAVWLLRRQAVLLLLPSLIILGTTPASGTPHGDGRSKDDVPALDVSVPEELADDLEDLKAVGEVVSDRLEQFDPEMINRVIRPFSRQALQLLLDVAPGLSETAIDLGEQGLGKLEERVQQTLEQVQTDFEQGDILE